MSPFFRRKKKSHESTEAAAQPVETTSAASAASANSAPPPTSAESVSSAPEAEEKAAPRRVEITRSREELMDEAYRDWHRELLDAVNEADEREAQTRHGQVDLTNVHPTGSAQFYGHSPTRLSSLIRENHALEQARSQLALLREDIARAKELHGHAPVTLTYGSVTWTELPEADDEGLWAQSYEATGELRLDPAELTSVGLGDKHEPGAEQKSDDAGVASDDSVTEGADTEGATGEAAETEADERPIREAREVTEPAVFRSIRLQFQGEGDAILQLTDRSELNPVLIRALRNHGVSADDLSELRQLGAESRSLDVVITRLCELGRIYLPGFTFKNRALLGSYSRPEHALLADLESMEPYIRTSGIMLALAGDEETRKLSSAPLPPIELEDRAPEVERGAGDLDVVELGAIEAVASGRSLVLDCPAGSERASTVASMMADAAASGRSVLFIPARASSAQALQAELAKLGLDDLVADFSHVDTVPRRLRTGMRLEKPEVDEENLLEIRSELADVRSKLSTFVGELHDVDESWGTSVAQLLEKLAQVTLDEDGPQTRVRLSAETIEGLNDGGADEVRELLREASNLSAFDPSISSSAWAKSTISDAAEGATALDEVRRLADITIPAAIGQSSRTAGETGLTQASTIAQWFEQIDVLDGIAESLDTFLPRIFETSPHSMVVATAPKEWREKHGHTMKSNERRRYKKQAQDLVRPGATPKDLHAELKLAQARRETWRRYTSEGGWPQLPDGMAQIRTTRDEISRDLSSLSDHLGGEDFEAMTFEQLQERLHALVADAGHMTALPERNAVLGKLRDRGLGKFLDDMAERKVRSGKVQSEFDLAYTSSVFEQLIGKSTMLAALGPVDLANLLERFRELDRAHTEALAGPVLRAVVNNSRSLMQERKSETLKFDEMLSRQGVSGLRDLIATYPRLAQLARPVWIVPPSVGAEFVPPMPWVDLAIVEVGDGASIASVISPMMRGRQVVVVGDTRRARMTERDGGAMKAFTSILPIIELPTVRARLDDMAIRALVEQGYSDVLSPYPARELGSTSKLVVVDGRGVPSAKGDGAVEGPKAEVDAVVEHVLEHAMERPDESLAVVTVSPVHAQRVRDALRQLKGQTSELAILDESETGENLTVLDISQVGGLRRDHIILSVGLGKTVHGRVLHSFGQLATPAGLTGLIDAIEAPREGMTIISSLAPGEISTSRVSTPGPRLLADILDYADGVVSETVETGDDDLAPLLIDLARRIERAGWKTKANFGFSGSTKIPLVVGHDDIPGTWAVAVVFDDDDYVDQPSLRRRDRYRVEALEARGWAVHQTFSTSLFVDPQGQAKAIVRLAKQVRDGDQTRPQVAVPSVDEWGNAKKKGPVRRSMNETSQQVRARGPRPDVAPGLQLAGYTDDQIQAIVRWIASDGGQRSEVDYVDAVREDLALRKGGQIDRVLGNIVRRSGVTFSATSETATAPAQGAIASESETSNEELNDTKEAHMCDDKKVKAEPDTSPATADPREYDYSEEVAEAAGEGMVETSPEQVPAENLEADPTEGEEFDDLSGEEDLR